MFSSNQNTIKKVIFRIVLFRAYYIYIYIYIYILYKYTYYMFNVQYTQYNV